MPVERLQSREEQDQQSDQTHRDASPNKKRVHDHCMLQYQRYDRKGKELALVEEEGPLNGVVVRGDGKKQIILRDHYDKDHPGLAGGGLQGAGAALESMLEFFTNFADFASNIAPDPATHLAMMALKTVLQMIQKNRENAVTNEKLDKLGNNPYYTASRLLNDVNYLQQPDNRKTTLDDSTTLFVSAIDVVKDGFMRTASMFYAGVCNDLREEPVAALKYFEEAYDTGCKQLLQTTEDIKELRYNPFKRGQRKRMEVQLQQFEKFMAYLEERKEHLRRQIENSPFSSTVTQENRDAMGIQELESINQALQRDKQNLSNQLKQEMQNLKKKLQEMTQLLEQQSFQQGDHGASTSRTSSFEKGEAGSSSIGREGTKSHAKIHKIVDKNLCNYLCQHIIIASSET